MVATGAFVFLGAICFYFLLIVYCHFEAKSNPTPTSTNTLNNRTSAQLCVDFYGKYPVDIIIYAANLISTNVTTLIITLGFCMSTYGWIMVPMAMKESIVQIYNEIKSTTKVLFIELCTNALTVMTTVWGSVSVIKTIQFAFLLLLLLSVPDFIDYFKKALVRFAKL